ncbi:STM4012 family radical SAM protein [Singulisphaera sp. Ch08]|uniref:STM4012 family radical SAM protein n=1 Tax=Singulisphaera sp. Ch08 TaxID=3120278 RepID=A0AAU7CCR1_9BACT
MNEAEGLIAGSPYVGYAYSYPHKTAYRPLVRPVPLGSLWSAESLSALFLYIHVPFCGMRCGFCNLFTKAKPDVSLIRSYLEAVARQAGRVRESLPVASFARFAIGGGTPTYLDVAGLESILDIAETTMGADLRRIGGSVEVAPGTVTVEKLALLRDRGIDRISIGVESFDEAETAAVYRPQAAETVEHALGLIRSAGFPTLNLDLIYGLPGQSVESWLGSVRKALRYRPEELFLYPLYVRPLTGLGKSRRDWDDLRLTCYREARSLLIGEGYAQVSMRMFRAPHAPEQSGPAYCCQDDGMVGLGCGARSYTRGLHHASEYAVGARGVAEILADYVARSFDDFGAADFGFQLGPEEQRRRFLIQSLLTHDGLRFAAYTRRFGTDASDDFPELEDCCRLGLAASSQGGLALTDPGLERSDAIGPWLYSREVRARMEDYSWR